MSISDLTTTKKRILLIDPKGFGYGLNLGLGYLSAVLVGDGHEVKVVDCNNVPERLSAGPKLKIGRQRMENWRQKIDIALAWQPDVIGISIYSFTQVSAYEIINYCRSKTKSETIYVAGGPHVTVFKVEFMEQRGDLFDFAVVGEGEQTIVELLRNVEHPQQVKGLIYSDRQTGEMIQTEERPPIDDLDSLPFPNIESFDTVRTQDGLFNYQMMSSRGCPYRCVFCSQVLSRKWRARSSENVLAEVKAAKEKFRIKTLTFWDDNFTLDIARAKRICDLFMNERVDLKYGLAGVRADRLDEELVIKLKQSGCTSIFVGIEDGDPETFPLVKKGETLEAIERAVRLVQKHRIPIASYMITGLINSTYASFLRSLAFVEKLGIPAHWNIAFPLPHTPLYDWAKANGRFLMTVEEGFKQGMASKNPPVVFDTEIYPKEQRLKAFYLGNLRSRSYDVLVSSRGDSFIWQALDILELIWKYDRGRILWHLYQLLKLACNIFVSSWWREIVGDSPHKPNLARSVAE